VSKADATRAERRDIARDHGWHTARQSIVLGYLAGKTHLYRESLTGAQRWATVDSQGWITANRLRDGEPEEWAWAFAHLMLHLGLDHLAESRLTEANAILPGGDIDPAYSAACCVAVQRFTEVVRIGREPFHSPELPGTDELVLARLWRDQGIPAEFTGLGAGGDRPCLVRVVPQPHHTLIDWSSAFAKGLSDAASAAMRDAAESSGQPGGTARRQSWDRAMSWFVSSYPLLGALSSGFAIVADPEIARAWRISVAAVSREHGEIYVNPYAGITDLEWRFVLAHEMLHAALRHDLRADGRDEYLWNVACDYVINGWLVDMGVGQIPDGTLYDQQLTGLSAESVYDTLATDLRRARKLRTLGGPDAGDVLGDWLSVPDAAHRRGSRRAEPACLPWQYSDRARQIDLDEFYRRALTQGLEYHGDDVARGYLPLGLEQEIRALDHPPLPWDARLARWFDEHVRAPEPQRSYARASRRQASSPDIPRPGRVRPEQREKLPTFGVVLDTSGSMPSPLLAKALGAIASYATAKDVPAARVVFCDAFAYDAGYLSVTEIAGRVKVRGRGGTILQPAIDLLQRADDFPADGPILIITDGACDLLRIRREHAFLVPVGAKLPFTPRGPVFRVSGE
jgi:predicted metal-dependent peptidase